MNIQTRNGVHKPQNKHLNIHDLEGETHSYMYMITIIIYACIYVRNCMNTGATNEYT